MIAAAATAVRDVLSSTGMEYRILFVDDGSADGTWTAIETQSSADPHVSGLRFSRNFGKEAAILARLASAEGDCAIVMDCDLQHPPELIPQMISLWQQGYMIVEGVKSDRGKENAGYGLMSRIFNLIMSRSTGVDMLRASDYKLLDKKVIAVLLSIREHNMFFRAASSMIGFRSTQIPFEVQARTRGVTKWSRKGLIRYAVTNITSYTAAPINVILALGVIMFFMTIGFGANSLIQYFRGTALGGFTTVILLQLIIGSMSMIGLGVIGYYIVRIFDEVRVRPRYVISDRTGDIAREPASE